MSLEIRKTYISPAPRVIDIYLLEIDFFRKKVAMGTLTVDKERKQGKGGSSGEREEGRKLSF